MSEQGKNQSVQRLADTPDGPVFLAAQKGGMKGGIIGGIIGSIITMIVCMICHYMLG